MAFSNRPRELTTPSGQPKLMSSSVREKLIYNLEAPGCGQDWEHFLLGLGRGFAKRDLVRLRQGDIDKLERNHQFNRRRIIRAAIEDFERNCQRESVAFCMTQHVIDVLRDEEVLYPAYTRYE